MEDIRRSITDSEITYSSKDGSIVINITYFTGFPRSNNCYGKTWARETQAVLRINGFVRAIGSVIKHRNDKDNMPYAIKAATEKVMHRVCFKDLRREIWDIVFNHIKEQYNADPRVPAMQGRG
jgi:hypothetical protein